MQNRAVDRGIAVLEQARPGSVAKLNPMTLDISSVFECAVGQTFKQEWEADQQTIWQNPYVYGLNRLKVENPLFGTAFESLGACYFGFAGPENNPDWRIEIDNRREEIKPVPA